MDPGLLILIAVVAVVYLVSLRLMFVLGRKRGIKKTRDKTTRELLFAALKGCGRWKCNPRTGYTEWEWLERGVSGESVDEDKDDSQIEGDNCE